MSNVRTYPAMPALMHAWANSPNSESGKCGNNFFEDGKLYSYGYHFVIARILPGVNANGERVAVFGTHTYSSSTGRQQSRARAAWNTGVRPTVYAHDPAARAADNKFDATRTIETALNNAATTRRIRDTTRDGYRADALLIAEQFNAYLAALPEDERDGVTPFDLTHGGFETLAEARAQRERDAAAAREADQARRLATAADAITSWRAGEYVRHNLHNLPPMLRLVRGKGLHTGGLMREGKADVIETSHGAEIPAKHAPFLWAAVQYCRKHHTESAAQNLPEVTVNLGAYTLREIRADGSIVVGCHDIAYSEIERIAAELGLIETATA